MNQLVGIGDRRRDHIGPACPLAKIDDSTAVATEREVGIIALDGLLADRTSQS